MNVERKGDKFFVELDLTELTTLYCLIAEGLPSVDEMKLAEPAKIKKIAKHIYTKTGELLSTRTPADLCVKFFK